MLIKHLLLLISIHSFKLITADNCSSIWDIQINSTDISFLASSSLQVILSKSPYQISIIDQTTNRVLLQSSRDIFAEIWEGTYETAYFGYMFRVGTVREHRSINKFTSFSCTTKPASIKFAYGDFSLTFYQQLDNRQINLQVTYNNFSNIFDPKPSHYVFPRLSLSFKSRDPEEDYYGFGSYWGFTRFRGQKLYCHSEDGSWSFFNVSTRIPQANATYIPMPLFISNRLYAIWVNETRRVNFDMSSTDEWIVTTEWNTTNINFYFPNKIKQRTGFPRSIQFEKYFHPYKKFSRKINPAFTALIEARGMTTRIPPIFAFGPWKQTGNVLINQTEIDVVQRMIDRDIPITVRIGTLHFFPKGAQQGQIR